MKTAVFYGGPDVRVEEVPDPLPGPGVTRALGAPRVTLAGTRDESLELARGCRAADERKSGAINVLVIP
jgi:hypothetical protein